MRGCERGCKSEFKQSHVDLYKTHLERAKSPAGSRQIEGHCEIVREEMNWEKRREKDEEKGEVGQVCIGTELGPRLPCYKRIEAAMGTLPGGQVGVPSSVRLG